MMPAVAPDSADMDVRQYSMMAEFWRIDSSLYAIASAENRQRLNYQTHTLETRQQSAGIIMSLLHRAKVLTSIQFLPEAHNSTIQQV